jgi:DNA modification methylase
VLNPFRIGDCLTILPTIPDNSVDLIATDPPYNIGVEYGPHYNDNLPYHQFCDFIDFCMVNLYRVCSAAGSLYWFMGADFQAESLVAAKRAGFVFRNSIIWHYTFGQSQKRKFTPSYTVCHYLTKHSSNFTFNHDDIKVPSMRQLKYNDKRAKAGGKTPDDVWVLNPSYCEEAFHETGDVWHIPRVVGNDKSRVGHATQLPMPICERIIRASSNPGDIVLDPFAGTGSFIIAAYRNDRVGVGIELSERTAAIAQQRFNEEFTDGTQA